MRVSVSQVNCVLRCQREWIFKYILKYPEPTSDALNIGRAFHELAEGKTLDPSLLTGLDSQTPWRVYFRRMLAGYQLERRKYAPSFRHEHEFFREDEIKLFIDEIARESNGDWWIIERKTRSQALGIKARMLASDLQLGVYSHYRKDYAKDLWLDPARWRGCVYIVTYKPTERRKKSRKKDSLGEWAETPEEWGERMTSSSESILVDKVDEIGAMATMDFGRRMIDFAATTYEKKGGWQAVPCRSESCIRFGNPCPFFNQCHGRAE